MELEKAGNQSISKAAGPGRWELFAFFGQRYKKSGRPKRNGHFMRETLLDLAL